MAWSRIAIPGRMLMYGQPATWPLKISFIFPYIRTHHAVHTHGWLPCLTHSACFGGAGGAGTSYVTIFLKN